MKKTNTKSVPKNQASSKVGSNFGVRQNDSKAGQNKSKDSLRK